MVQRQYRTKSVQIALIFHKNIVTKKDGFVPSFFVEKNDFPRMRILGAVPLAILSQIVV